MNKNIHKIAQEAGMVEYPTSLGAPPENTIWGDKNIEKFATLLVQDIIYGIAWNKPRNGVNSPENLFARKIVNHLKNTYGVEYPVNRVDIPDWIEEPSRRDDTLSREDLEHLERYSRVYKAGTFSPEGKQNDN